MSDSLPENPLSGILRVVKLITGDELVGLVNESMPDRITIKLPAKLEAYHQKNANNEIIEYVKLANYAASLKGYEITVQRSSIIYIGQPNVELEKMYEIYFIAMQTDPKSVSSNMPDGTINVDDGLHLLNDLFNNPDFVNFVNDLIENFEGVEILTDLDEDDEPETPTMALEDVEQEPAPQPKKRRPIKPEGNKMPYKPNNPPEDPKSWSDNPSDYL